MEPDISDIEMDQNVEQGLLCWLDTNAFAQRRCEDTLLETCGCIP